jgi:hypothetical protein
MSGLVWVLPKSCGTALLDSRGGCPYIGFAIGFPIHALRFPFDSQKSHIAANPCHFLGLR